MILVPQILDSNTQDVEEIDRADDNIDSNSKNHLMTGSSSQVNMQTLEKSIYDKVSCEVDSVVALVETRIHNSVLSAIDNFVIPKVEGAMRSTDSS